MNDKDKNQGSEPTIVTPAVLQQRAAAKKAQTPAAVEQFEKDLVAKEKAKAEKQGTKSGTTLPETARLHEKAVQAVAKGEVPKKPRRARKKAEKRQPKVHTHVKVIPEVWDKAVAIRDAEDNTYTKLEILSEREVLIR